MDPYLEYPALWPGVHLSLIAALRDALVPLVRPKYIVVAELRVYEERLDRVESIGVGDLDVVERRRVHAGPNGTSTAEATPDSALRQGGPRVLAVQVPPTVEVREHYLEVRARDSRDLVTTIEVLSPTNKRPGVGRDLYERKRQEIVSTLTSLVELDLVRAGEPLPLLHHGGPIPPSLLGDYRVLVSRGHQRHHATLYPIEFHETLPPIPVPLRPDDNEPEVDLQSVLTTVYDRGGFDLIADYSSDPVPPLTAEQAAWADRLLRARGLR